MPNYTSKFRLTPLYIAVDLQYYNKGKANMKNVLFMPMLIAKNDRSRSKAVMKICDIRIKIGYT